MVGGALAVNLVLVAVVYVALAYGPVTGLLAGTVGGLAQDALAGGIVGIGGLSKTMVGFAVGVLGAQFIVSQTGAAIRDVRGGDVRARVDVPGAARPGRVARLRDALFGGAGSGGRERRSSGCAAFWIVENGPRILDRRRARQAAFSKRRF